MDGQELKLFASCTWPLEPSEHAVHELLQLPGTGRQPMTPGGDSVIVAFLLSFIVIGMGAMRSDVHEMSQEERHAPPKAPRKRDDSAASSGRRRKRSSRWSSRTFLCIAVAVMMILAMMSAQQSVKMSTIPELRDYALEELSVNSARLKAFGRDKITSLKTEAPPDCIVALIVSIMAAVGCKVCHSDLLDMQAEEEKRQQQAQKNAKKDSRQDPHQIHDSTAPDSPFFALPLMLRIALGFAMLGNIVLFAFAAHSGWLQSDMLKLIVPSLHRRGLAGIAQLSIPLPSDEVTVLSLAVFALIGMIVVCIDFATFVDEEKAKLEASAKQDTKKETNCSRISKKKPEDVSWMQCLSMHWRMVSCVVLLLSMFASTAAHLWENAM